MAPRDLPFLLPFGGPSMPPHCPQLYSLILGKASKGSEDTISLPCSPVCIPAFDSFHASLWIHPCLLECHWVFFTSLPSPSLVAPSVKSDLTPARHTFFCSSLFGKRHIFSLGSSVPLQWAAGCLLDPLVPCNSFGKDLQGDTAPKPERCFQFISLFAQYIFHKAIGV